MFPLHALLFRLRVIMMYPSLIACYNVLQKQIPAQLHEHQIFTLSDVEMHYFLAKDLWGLLCIDFFHQQMFMQDCLNGSYAYTHSVGHQLHIDSTIFQCSVFNSTTAFFTNSFRQTSRPGLIFKSSSLMKLDCPVLTETCDGASSP